MLNHSRRTAENHLQNISRNTAVHPVVEKKIIIIIIIKIIVLLKPTAIEEVLREEVELVLVMETTFNNLARKGEVKIKNKK